MKNAGRAFKLFKKDDQIEYLKQAISIINKKQLDEMFALDVAAEIPEHRENSSDSYIYAAQFKSQVDTLTANIWGSLYELEFLLKTLEK